MHAEAKRSKPYESSEMKVTEGSPLESPFSEAKRSTPYESSEMKVTEGSPLENPENRNGGQGRGATTQIPHTVYSLYSL